MEERASEQSSSAQFGYRGTARVMRMLLLHDIVEIDVGDPPIHRGTSGKLQAGQEPHAAGRWFALLPQSQRDELLGLWTEFEEAQTGDAMFANALDRFSAAAREHLHRRSNLDRLRRCNGTGLGPICSRNAMQRPTGSGS